MTILERATDIIDDFGQATNADTFTIIAQLEQQLNNDDGVILSDQERATLNELQTVLSVTDKLNPQARTATNIDQYLQQLEQFS